VIAELTHRGLPNLWLPDPKNCYPVAELPTLASGKLDLQAVKRLVEQTLCGESAA
jgi:acyl-[acyl-carrier-protein]-phospholipid O-acyltransferase/long-chain-fatty-acid--[acyl-carrier-protein] ligase